MIRSVMVIIYQDQNLRWNIQIWFNFRQNFGSKILLDIQLWLAGLRVKILTKEFIKLIYFHLVDSSSSSNIQPDSYKLFIWNNKDKTRDKPMDLPLTSKIFLRLLNNNFTPDLVNFYSLITHWIEEYVGLAPEPQTRLKT